MKKNFRGQGLVEYAILIALIAIGIALALKLYGISVYDTYCYAAAKISGSEACKPVQLCQDDFSTDLAGWTSVQGSKGSIAGGKFCPPNYTLMLNACSVSKPLKDYTVTLNDSDLKSGSGYGVVFRAENTPNGMNGYVFQYDPGYSPGSFIIRKWVNGRELSVPIAVAKASGYDWYNTPRDIQVVVKGDTFTAYVDGTPVLTATDSTYTSGGTGIRTWDSTQVCFDQFGMQSAP
jgi:Flp pilus assembly pilin Flp